MKYIRNAISVTLLACCVMSLLFLFVLTRAAFYAPKEIKDGLGDTRAALVKEADDTRTQVLAEVDKQATGLRKDVTGQISALRKDTMTRVDNLTVDVNNQTTAALGIANTRIGGALDQVTGLRSDLKPTLSNTAALTKDAQDSWDDLYWDIKASVESGTVTIHSIAVASEAIADAAPKLAASAVGIGNSADGIAVDVHKETTELTKPKTFMQQVYTWLLAIARILGAA